MGKDLNGKELGKGLAQRADGYYTARFVDQTGKRVQAYFDKPSQARTWLEDAKSQDRNNTVAVPFNVVADDVLKKNAELPSFNNMTVNEWFDFWIDSIIPDLAGNTRRNYRDRYERNIRPVIGNLKVGDVRPFHCKKVLLDMEDDYAGSTIRQTYITMGTMFKSALMNGVISKHPMDGVRYTKAVKGPAEIKFLTIEEEDNLRDIAKRSFNYNQYELILQTGIRTSELIGLTWDMVDFKKKKITIEKQLWYNTDIKDWEAGAPKTIAGYRDIQLTSQAYSILAKLYDERKTRFEAPELDRKLKYIDRRSGEIRYLNMKDLVFINRKGMPNKNSSYDTHLYKLCENAGIKHISMHGLRHTFATRAIERGIAPKVLQVILGHSHASVTMDTYVHVTDESLVLAARQFEKSEI